MAAMTYGNSRPSSSVAGCCRSIRPDGVEVEPPVTGGRARLLTPDSESTFSSSRSRATPRKLRHRTLNRPSRGRNVRFSGGVMYFNVFGERVSRRRHREMLTAAKNRRELIAAGLGRRDLFRMGLLTSA